MGADNDALDDPVVPLFHESDTMRAANDGSDALHVCSGLSNRPVRAGIDAEKFDACFMLVLGDLGDVDKSSDELIGRIPPPACV